MSHIALNGITVQYDDVGHGEDVVVLVHGHPFDRSMWKPQLERLPRAGWRVIAADLRGYGGSSVVPGTTTLETFADDIAALLDARGVERAAIAGLSMGGQIAMAFCRKYPNRVRALVLAATFPQAETEAGKTLRQEMARRLLREGMDGYAHETLPKMVGATTLATRPEVGEHVLGMMRSAHPEGAAAALLGRAQRPDYGETLASIRVPALVVVGDEDAFTSRRDALHMHELLKESELLWLEKTGHMPNLEREEEFNQALVRLLARVPSAHTTS